MYNQYMKNLYANISMSQSLILIDGTKICIYQFAKNTPDEIASRNLFRTGNDGSIIWQVEKYQVVPNLSTFTTMRFVDKDTVEVYNYDGGIFKIDVKTGKIVNREFVR